MVGLPHRVLHLWSLPSESAKAPEGETAVGLSSRWGGGGQALPPQLWQWERLVEVLVIGELHIEMLACPYPTCLSLPGVVMARRSSSVLLRDEGGSLDLHSHPCVYPTQGNPGHARSEHQSSVFTCRPGADAALCVWPPWSRHTMMLATSQPPRLLPQDG